VRLPPVVCLAALVTIAAVVTTATGAPERATIVTALPWAGHGVWLRAETHVHSKFSDGYYTIDQILEHAVANGCDAVAITDHSDANLRAATPEYHAAIAAAQSRWPNLVIVTGLEWNVPPGKGQDHAALLLPPALADESTTAEFKRRFDDLDKKGENSELAVAAFEFLRSKTPSGSEAPVVLLNHPSRRAKDVDEVQEQLAWLSRVGAGIFIGAEGAPGHQNMKNLGAYGVRLHPAERWDPAIAPPGRAWDRLSISGASLSGALATSDFHSDKAGDFWPCQFSSTWVYAPERSVSGVLQALRAGAFVGVHGGIARRVELAVMAPGLARAAQAGEVIRASPGTHLAVDVAVDVPETDWMGAPNQVDAVQLIASAAGGIVVTTKALGTDGRARFEAVVPAGGLILRARGRRVTPVGSDLLFYTNAVRVVTSARKPAPVTP
jgi:hypothetical protein